MALLNRIVPPALLDLARQIDASGYSPKDKQLKLEQLEFLANKHIPYLQGKQVQVAVNDIDKDLADILNKFDFSKVSSFKMALAKPIITKWVQQNLKLKR